MASPGAKGERRELEDGIEVKRVCPGQRSKGWMIKSATLL